MLVWQFVPHSDVPLNCHINRNRACAQVIDTAMPFYENLDQRPELMLEQLSASARITALYNASYSKTAIIS
jgi:hypothetical protein